MANPRTNCDLRYLCALFTAFGSVSLALVLTSAFFAWIAQKPNVLPHRLLVLAVIVISLVTASLYLARGARLRHGVGLLLLFSALFATGNLLRGFRIFDGRWATLSEAGRYDIVLGMLCSGCVIALSLWYSNLNGSRARGEFDSISKRSETENGKSYE